MIRSTYILAFYFSLISCYSFKGISIPPEVSTFAIDPVIDQSFNAPATYPIDFSEAMITKIRKESRLSLNNQNPDVILDEALITNKERITKELADVIGTMEGKTVEILNTMGQTISSDKTNSINNYEIDFHNPSLFVNIQLRQFYVGGNRQWLLLLK